MLNMCFDYVFNAYYFDSREICLMKQNLIIRCSTFGFISLPFA